MRRTKQQIETFGFHLLLLLTFGLAGWLSHHYHQVWDWTETGRNSLHPASQHVLTRLDAPLKITSFSPENAAFRQQILDVIERYRRFQPQIEFEFINPSLEPELTRTLGIQVSGELRLEYKGRSENLRTLTEEQITNTIQRLLLQGSRWLISLKGHGERKLTGRANHDLGDYGGELERRGYRLQTLDLTETQKLPENTSLLMITAPQSGYLPGETETIQRYLESGGNLLWLIDPGEETGLDAVAQSLGIEVLPGVVVDPNAAKLGLENPTFVLVPSYPDHPAASSFELLTLYPQAAALDIQSRGEWQATPLLTTLPRTWNEMGPIRGEVSRNPEQGERKGPLVLGYALSRQHNDRQQRVVVVGDGDFLSNTFIGNGGNLQLGLNLAHWLTRDEALIDIPARTGSDLSLELTRSESAIIGLGFLLVLPLTLFTTGTLIWWRRRRR